MPSLTQYYANESELLLQISNITAKYFISDCKQAINMG